MIETMGPLSSSVRRHPEFQSPDAEPTGSATVHALVIPQRSGAWGVLSLQVPLAILTVGSLSLVAWAFLAIW